MTTKLAIKHKDSLALNENKPFGKDCVIRKQSKRWELLLPWITFSVFLVYWFVLCPLIWATGLLFKSWLWFSIFWVVAFLIWMMIMCVLITLWRRFLAKQSHEINAISKYGSDKDRRPLSVQQVSPKDAEFLELKKWNDFYDSESKKSDQENLRRDLPPLVIHKQISGENIEDTTGVVHVEEDEKTRLNIASDYAEKSPLQNYLKLVTVSPSEEKEVKSLKSPMSPRELFFIDLIREADRVESARSLKTRSHFFPREATENDMKRRTYFFPSETTENDIKTRTHFFPNEAIANDNAETTEGERDEKDTEDVERRKNIKDTEDTQNEKANKSKSKRESSYFIADVESPTTERTEVFLQIDSIVDEEMGLIVEKPMLILQSNEANMQDKN